jgi:hypothetical protein
MLLTCFYREIYWSGERVGKDFDDCYGHTKHKCNHTDTPFYSPQVLIQKMPTPREEKHQTPPR